MRGKKAKRIRRRANELVLEWLHSMVPEGEETDRIRLDNIHDYLPDETHFYATGQYRLHAMLPRWVARQLRRKGEHLQLKDLLHG